jgi:recombination protein RecA
MSKNYWEVDLMSKDLDKVIESLNKKFGEGTITTADKAKALNLRRIPTGSLAIDIVAGGGIPENRITMLVGEESTGKSMVAQKIIANAQKKFKKEVEEGIIKDYKRSFWIDAEGTFDEEWARALGVDTESLYIAKPQYGEEALDIADVIIRSRECGVIVIDSLAHLVPKVEVDGSMDDQQMGVQARMINKFLRKISGGMNKYDMTNEEEKPPTVILINQYRESIGQWGDNRVMPGGRGQRFAPSVTLELRHGDWIKVTDKDTGNKEIAGHWLKAYGKKNKTAPPKRTGEVKFYFKDTERIPKGNFDTVDEIVRYAIHYNMIRQAGAWYYVEEDGEEKSFQGRLKLVQYLQDRPEKVEELHKDVLDIVYKG